MNILCRDATASDYDAIADVSLAAYKEYAQKLEAENWQKMKQSLLAVNEITSSARFLVAEVDQSIVGSLAYYPPGSSNPKFFTSQWASLRLLAVAPNHRGRGIGKLLTKEAIARAKQDRAEVLGLYTSEIMTTAQRMYSNLGFKRDKELPPMLGLRYWLYLLPITSQ
jgi:ribosomal protein S18 acetylase RimI-like enzyme